MEVWGPWGVELCLVHTEPPVFVSYSSGFPAQRWFPTQGFLVMCFCSGKL